MEGKLLREKFAYEGGDFCDKVKIFELETSIFFGTGGFFSEPYLSHATSVTSRELFSGRILFQISNPKM